MDSHHEPLAIIGMAGRFPGARDVRALWGNLCGGTESIASLSEAQLLAAGAPRELLRNPAHVCVSAAAEGLERFDAEFFGVSPREAELMDPQLRLALETVWEALEDAGLDPTRDGAEVGVFMAASLSSYLMNNLLPNRSLIERAGAERFLILNDKDFYPTTVSYRLNLRGPSVSVGTACSSSLVAVHLACQSLVAGECRVAIAGGSSVHVPFGRGYLYTKDGIYSPDGHCRPFDAAAQGTVGSDGAAFVVLKRYRDATGDRDRIHALVLGGAVNNDGNAKAGFTAPSVGGQSAVIRAALARSGVSAEQIGYVEAHGTGTTLGDPIEFAALSEAFREDTQRSSYCALGSLKANVGHLDAAAGVAGLIKASLVVRDGLLPPAVNFEKPNSHIDLPASPFFVNKTLRPWPEDGRPRLAGVSAFGVGGTNAHLIVQEAPPEVPCVQGDGPWIFPVSARNEREFHATVDRLRNELSGRDHALADVAFTLARGRKTFPVRQAFVAATGEELTGRLAGAHPNQAPARPPLLRFFAPPRGGAPAQIGCDLFARVARFRQGVLRCLDVTQDRRCADQLVQSFENAGGPTSPDTGTVREFVFQYALATMLIDSGARPDGIFGLDVGELVASALSGSLDLAVALSIARGLDDERPTNRAMLVKLSERDLRAILPRHVSVAAVCAPEVSVIDGPATAVESLYAMFARAGVARKWLRHPPSTALTALANAPERNSKRGRPPVGIDEALHTAAREAALWIELGIGRTLTALLRRNGLAAETALPGLSAHPRAPESARALDWLASLWKRGVELDWVRLLEHRGSRICSLPAYPFQSRHYWVDPHPGAEVRREPEASAVRYVEDPPKRNDIGAWFYAPVWRSWTGPTSTGALSRRWLLFANGDAISAAIERALRSAGQGVVLVRHHTVPLRLGPRDYRIRADRPDDYAELIDGVLADGNIDGILHAWTVSSIAGPDTVERIAAGHTQGIHSLLFIMQALGRSNVTRPLRLCILANNTQEVGGGDLIRPGQASLKGFAKLIPQEYSNVRCVHIDLDGRQPFDEAESRRLVAVLQSDTREPFLASRNREWFRPDFAPVRAPAVTVVPGLRERGVYLVTGGLGGVGLTIAGLLARETRARLVLLGRTAMPSRSEWKRFESEPGLLGDRVRRIQQIEALGAEVMVLAADVGDRPRMEQVLRQAEERFGPVQGVIHAAAVPDLAGVMQRRTRRSIERAMAAKVQGTIVLDTLLAGHRLDFFVLCSALGATVYNLKFGEVGYVAANDFLNAYSHFLRSTRGVPAVTIGWTDWLDVGMSAEAQTRFGQPREEFEDVEHPLWERRKQVDKGIEYGARVHAAAHWIFYGHRIAGCPTLPGTGVIELVAAAFCAETSSPCCEIRHLSLLSPLSVEEWRVADLHLTLEARGDASRCTLTSIDDCGQQTIHATGLVSHLPVGAGRASLPIDAIRARCPRSRSFAAGERRHALDGIERSEGIDLDARWDVVREVWLGSDEGLARLELSAEFLDELRAFRWHPALLDSAVAFLNHQIAVRGARYLPIGYERIRLRGALEPVLYSHGRWTASADRRGEILRFDFTIVDASGAVIAEIDGLTVRRVSPAAVAELPARSVSHRLEIGQPAILSTLGFQRFVAPEPPGGYVEIEVIAAGLNFKEVLTALGLVDRGRPFGLECAGRVTRVGAAVLRWKPGDEVIAFGAEWTMPLACVPETWMQSKPAALSFQEAATVPVAFTVAYHALVHEARLQHGETVLIHSGCGGVGLAAIQIARRLGARIMATAGTPAKRARLGDMGVECISDSRSPVFARDALAWTGGRGVDVVLNSLAGDLLDRGLDSLARRGRFVELGRRDLSENRAIGLQRLAKGVQFLPVLPDPNDPAFVTAWHEVVALFLDRELAPLPYRSFGGDRIAEAFEEMSKGGHVGKLLVAPNGIYPPVSKEVRASARRQMDPAVRTLVQGMTPSEGAEAFRRALSLDLPEVLVSTQDLGAMLQQQAIVSEHGHEAFWSARKGRVGPAASARSAPANSAEHPDPDMDIDIDARLREIWRDLLGVVEIGPDDDFFEVGGDSLIAVRMIARIKEVLDVEQTLARLFEASTFRQMSDSIRSARASSMTV